MRPKWKKTGTMLACLVLISLGPEAVSAPQRPLPNPVLFYIGPQEIETGGKKTTRYRFGVSNSDAYPDELFTASPDLPPCGVNVKASRTWIDFYDQSGKRLNGFCNLSKSNDLDGIWFAMESGEVPPSWVYIEMNDRKTKTKYKSNLAETTQ